MTGGHCFVIYLALCGFVLAGPRAGAIIGVVLSVIALVYCFFDWYFERPNRWLR